MEISGSSSPRHSPTGFPGSLFVCASELMTPHSQSSKTPFVIITGLSGSGKGTVLKAFEDMGYFCVDNLPVELVVKFAELSGSAGSQSKKAAIVIDVREGAELSKFPAVFRKLPKIL